MKGMRGYFLLILVLFVSGCSSISQTIIDKQEWTKAEFSWDEFQRDKYDCLHESYMEASQIAPSGRSGDTGDHRAERSRKDDFHQRHCRNLSSYRCLLIVFGSKPWPSSSTAITAFPSLVDNRTQACSAWACFLTLVSAS